MPLKCHILSLKTAELDNSASFTSSRMKDVCQKMEGKTNFSRRQEPGLLKVWKSLTLGVI